MQQESYELFKQWHASAGMTYFKRKKVRAFSFNIFHGNLEDLKRACEFVENQENGIKLMSESYADAGVRAHMDVNRLFHNYLASAKTLVDHTRVFVDKNYEKTSIQQAYYQKVQETFSNDPLCRFIQDLRNYIVHRGLPNSEMSLTVTNDKESGSQEFDTTVSLDRESLLEWTKWSKKSRRYLDQSNRKLRISDISVNYGTRVVDFYNWLEAKLEKFHTDEIAEFERLRKAYEHARNYEERDQGAI